MHLANPEWPCENFLSQKTEDPVLAKKEEMTEGERLMGTGRKWPSQL